MNIQNTKYKVYAIKEVDTNTYGVFARKDGGERRREYKFSFNDEAQTITHVPGKYLPKEAVRKNLFSPAVTRAGKNKGKT